MLAIASTVLPIFALILAGWGARRLGVLGPHSTQELNRFVVYLALPALLFDIVANADWQTLWQPGFAATFGLGMMAVFAFATIISLLRTRDLGNAAINGLNAAYANNGYMGFPLALAVFGPWAMAPTLLACILTVCVLFAVALVLVEVAQQRTATQDATSVARRGGPVRNVVLALVRNPLLVAPAVGAVFLAAGVEVPDAANRFLKLLGAAASPCALVALGLFLAEPQRATPGAATSATTASTAWLVGLKLLLQPLATWALAVWVFQLPAEQTHLAVLLAALPTGTGPFMVAALYGREAALTARVILASVIASLVTLTLYLHWIA